MDGLAAGAVAPDIGLPAVRTKVCPGREWAAGRPVVLVFHGRDNRDAARAVVQSVRNRHGDAASVATVNVVDLSMFPRMLRRMVDGDLERAFAAEAANLPGDRDPESYVVIVPDHDGRVTRAWGVSGTAATVAAVVVDGDWRVCAQARGADAADAVLAALAALPAAHATSVSAPDRP